MTTPESTAGVEPTFHASDVLMNVIVTLLAPMFLCATNGNLTFARMAALETVNAYRLRNQADLIAVAQIIAFGLAALGSLSLSMADDLSLSMTLRLRANANALNRSSEQNRRAIRQSSAVQAEPSQPEREDTKAAQPLHDQDAPAIPLRPETPPSPPKAAATPKPAAMPAPDVMSDLQRNTMWANAMADVASEYAVSLPHLPPNERKAASIRATALSSCASELLSSISRPDAAVAPATTATPRPTTPR